MAKNIRFEVGDKDGFTPILHKDCVPAPAPSPAPILKVSSTTGWAFSPENALLAQASLKIRLAAAAELEAMPEIDPDLQAKQLARDKDEKAKAAKDLTKTPFELIKKGDESKELKSLALSGDKSARDAKIAELVSTALSAAKAPNGNIDSFIKLYGDDDRQTVETNFEKELTRELEDLCDQFSAEAATPVAEQPITPSAMPLNSAEILKSVPELKTSITQEM